MLKCKNNSFFSFENVIIYKNFIIYNVNEYQKQKKIYTKISIALYVTELELTNNDKQLKTCTIKVSLWVKSMILVLSFIFTTDGMPLMIYGRFKTFFIFTKPKPGRHCFKYICKQNKKLTLITICLHIIELVKQPLHNSMAFMPRSFCLQLHLLSTR